MTEAELVTIDQRRFAALVSALLLARYAMLHPGSRIMCPPHTNYGLARTIDVAIADAQAALRSVPPGSVL